MIDRSYIRSCGSIGVRVLVAHLAACCCATWLGCGSAEPSTARPSIGMSTGAGGSPPLAGMQGAADPPSGTGASVYSPWGGSPSGGTPGPAAGGDPNLCAAAEVETTRVVPTVWLLIDGSGSMGTPLLGGGTRWSALREALLDPTGVIATLQDRVSFGLYVYDGGAMLPNPLQSPDCPRTVIVDPALGNYAALSAAYPLLQTGASTTTHWALVELQKRIAAAGPNPGGRTYVVIATDGQPNMCDFHDGIPSDALFRDQAVQTVRELAEMGTRSFVISVAGNEPGLGDHLQSVATAGDTGKPAFSPESKDDLVDALTEIIGEAVSCDVTLRGKVEEGLECSGTVMLNGTALVCDSTDGYVVGDDRMTLTLQGSACGRLRTDPSTELRAAFPCGAVVLE